MPSLVPKSVETPRFRDLRVRAKLMILHNIFFLVLTGGVYYSVIPLVENQVQSERQAGAISAGEAERGATEAELRLFAVLGLIYVLAVLGLELLVMPRYVYQPIQSTLDADEAVQEGDRQQELIPATAIPGDEIGDIMRSRNATVRKLREKEAGLELALERVSELAKDLQHKNEQLESARRGMAAQDRLATIGLLSASVAHELNTPLSVLRGSIEQLQESVDDPQARERLARIRRVTDRLGRISESLLDFSRTRHSDRRGPVKLKALVDEAWGLLAIDERASAVTFRNEIPPDWEATGDDDRLMQVFVNLLKNGIFALDQGGGITVGAHKQRDADGEWIAVDVDDDGPGIPEEVLPNIFEAFVSSRLDSRGTGLGLTVADGIVQQHGGQLIAANRTEGGARLTVRLPTTAAMNKEKTG